MSKKKETRQDALRRERARRRKRNQRIAYIVLFVVVLALVAGGFFGGRILLDKYKSNKAAEEVVATAEPTPEAEIEPEVVVEEIPEITPEPTEEPTPEVTKEDLMNEMVENIVSQMTLEEKVAGLFIVSPESLTKQGTVTKAGDGTKTALESYPVGGIVYSKKNFTGVDQFTTMVNATVEDCRYPLFIAVDEDGCEQAVSQKGLSIPSAQAMGEAGDTAATYENYKQMGIALKECGVNLMLGPVADINFGSSKKGQSEKMFGSDATICSDNVAQAVNGLSDGGVWCCVNHFPGQGGTNGDPHNALVGSNHNADEFKNVDFVPFKSAIDNGVDMMMVGDFAAEGLTGDGTTMCSMSKEVMTDIIRGELEYGGVVITDAMNAMSISNYYASDEVAIKALKAGADMILLPEDFELAYNGVLTAVQEGTISEERINDALKRIYKVKYEDALLDE